MNAPKERVGLDWLLKQHAEKVVFKVDNNGPWTIVDFYGTGNRPPQNLEDRVDFLVRFAIWNHTGNVYTVGENGAVEDDPIYEVTPL